MEAGIADPIWNIQELLVGLYVSQIIQWPVYDTEHRPFQFCLLDFMRPCGTGKNNNAMHSPKLRCDLLASNGGPHFGVNITRASF